MSMSSLPNFVAPSHNYTDREHIAQEQLKWFVCAKETVLHLRRRYKSTMSHSNTIFIIIYVMYYYGGCASSIFLFLWISQNILRCPKSHYKRTLNITLRFKVRKSGSSESAHIEKYHTNSRSHIDSYMQMDNLSFNRHLNEREFVSFAMPWIYWIYPYSDSSIVMYGQGQRGWGIWLVVRGSYYSYSTICSFHERT